MPTSLLKKVEQSEFLAQMDALGAGTAVAVAMADLDRFKSINDKYGHEGGDRVLEAWERTLTGSLPKEAVVGRLGGDEYVVALPEHSAESALILFEEIRSHFASHPPKGIDLPLDCSIGIASRPPHATDGEHLIKAAYEALMRAKREGKSRTAIFVEEKMTLKSNYYSRATLDRLAKLSGATSRTEASLLREALDDLLQKHRDSL